MNRLRDDIAASDLSIFWYGNASKNIRGESDLLILCLSFK